MKNADMLPNCYTKWISGSTLLGTIPALHPSNPKSQSYYSVTTNDGMQVGVAFLYVNNNILPSDIHDNIPLHQLIIPQMFIFDTEFNKLVKYNCDGTYRKLPTYEDTARKVNENPVVLFFHGNDDGHVGFRFGTIEQATTFLNTLVVFEDVFSYTAIQYHN